jgi:hypothetical protein
VFSPTLNQLQPDANSFELLREALQQVKPQLEKPVFSGACNKNK